MQNETKKTKELFGKYLLEVLFIALSLFISDYAFNNFSNTPIIKIGFSFLYFVAVMFFIYILFNTTNTNFLNFLKYYFSKRYWFLYIIGYLFPIVVIILYILNPEKYYIFSRIDYCFNFALILLTGAGLKNEEAIKKEIDIENRE